ncbi:MAG: heterodisulfide reductase-related iron-sulfur binding cluster [Burkholderiales bacterium]|nr:heterodisulfide reductase-related iron-sulfur binding cluster [Burkholderiales bacterium]
MKSEYRRVAYYPGCALEGTAHAYDRSTRAVGRALGLELEEVRNWNCCGAMEVKNIDPRDPDVPFLARDGDRRERHGRARRDGAL